MLIDFLIRPIMFFIKKMRRWDRFIISGVRSFTKGISTIRLSNFLADHAKRRAFYYVDGLTGLRGFAALWVLIYHVWVASTPRRITIGIGSISIDLTPFFSCGWAGVDIFYTLSAFLLTLPFAEAVIQEKKGPPLLPYFYRRVLRVFPAYYAQLGILLILAWFGTYGEIPNIGNLLTHLFMVHNISFDYFTSMNGIWWTLPVEFSFYLVLPVLALLLRRRRWPILLVVAIMVTISYRYLMFQSIAQKTVEYKVWLLEQLPGHIDQFVFGVLAAYFYVKLRQAETSNPKKGLRPSPRACIFFGIIGVIIFLYLLHVHFLKYWDGHFLLFIWHGCAGFFIAVMIYGIATDSRLGPFLFGNRFVVGIGVISYSLYLWHLLVIDWLQRWGWFIYYKGYLFPVLLPVALSVSLGLATLSYFFIERPFLKRGTPKKIA
jgi:peptidoglycan/LPS O-acetylase OafA/YrhL